MIKRLALLCVILMMLALAGCVGRHVPSYGGTAPQEPIPTPGPTGTMPPMIFVNDILYLPGTAPWYIPEICEDWAFVGEVQSLTEHFNTIPTQHLQTNHSESFLGARVYHSPSGRIRVSRRHGGAYSYREIYGDSLIVIVNGEKQHYVSEEAHGRVNEILGDATW